ncbi:hypothetical protein MACJ_003458 [Theileria orientalis]|uniref:Uncharacterized protein n=1 Tax=Theileria orientalis TaxID=68886 RepID=A0A976XJW4_THEOR|nr:hypothetical protein MACJ_003458 [Theileria orientalis]
MEDTMSLYDNSDYVAAYDEYHNTFQGYYPSHAEHYKDSDSPMNTYEYNYQFRESYVPKNTQFNSFLQKYSNNHRKIDTMFRFYRISNNLNINNPDRIYNMFLTRLKNRKRLESSQISLELVVAALFYIDQRNNGSTSYTLRDILSRIPNCRVTLKEFSGIISRLSKEAGVTKLSTVQDDSVISNMLEKLRTYCAQNIDGTGESMTPSCTTTVLLNMNEFGDLDNMINGSTENLDLTEDSYSKDIAKDQGGATKDRVKYRLIHKLICSNYDRIEKASISITNLLNDTIDCSEDVLDPKIRIVFRCKKTLISCIIFIVLSAMKIPVTCTLMCNAMGLARPSFYRNYRNLMFKLSSMVDTDETLKTIKKDTFCKRILLLSESKGGVLDSEDNRYSKNKDNIENVHESKKIEKQSFKATDIINTNKLTYLKSLRCLDVLNTEYDSSNGKDYDTGPNESPVYYDKTGNKYICCYTVDGKKKKKTYSVNLYGNDVAFNLAKEFSKLTSNNFI